MPRADRQDLTEFAQTGSQAAFERLARRYAGLVYGVCSRRLADPADAEDAGQAVFLALARKARSVRPEKLASWLHGAAIRAALMTARSRATRARREEEAARMRRQEDTRTGRDWEAIRPQLDAAVERLPAGLREVVARHYLAGLSYAQIGEELGLPKTTVASRVQAGLARLRAGLAGRDVSVGTAALGTLLAEHVAAAPEGFLSSLPGLLSDTAATGATAGAVHAVTAIAEGVLRMMLWEKLKVIAAVLAGVAALSAALPAAMHVAGAERSAGEAAPPVPPPKPPAGAPEDARVKAEWRGKLLVQLCAAASEPAWSPDGRGAACCVALKQEPGRGFMRTTEGGVAVVEPATGKTRSITLSRTGPVTGLAWMPDGRSLLATGAETIFTVKIDGPELALGPAIRPKLPPDLALGGVTPSPTGSLLLCRLEPKRMLPLKQFLVLAPGGDRVATFEGNAPIWTSDGKAIYFSRYQELCRLTLPGGREEVVFTSGDYFKGGPPPTHRDWLWSPRPASELPGGELLLEFAETAGPKYQPVPGIVSTAGEMAIWTPKDGRNAFRKLGPTRHGIGGQIDYARLGESTILLRTDTSRRTAGNDTAETLLHLVDASTGKDLLELKLPAKLTAEGQEVPVSYRPASSDRSGDTFVLTASGRINKPVGRQAGRFVSMPHWFGLFVVETASGTFRRVEPPLARVRGDAAVSGDGSLLLISGTHRTPDGTDIEGVWMCSPGGTGVLPLPGTARGPRSGPVF